MARVGQPVSLLCCSVWGRDHRGDDASAWPPGSCLSSLALHFLPICHWCPSSCCTGAKSQRQWVRMSPKAIAGPFMGVSLNPAVSSEPQPPLVFTARSYFPGAGSLGWMFWTGAGIPCSRGIPPVFLSTTHGCRTAHFHLCTSLGHSMSPLSPPLLPVWNNVASLSPRLSDFHTAQFSDGSG